MVENLKRIIEAHNRMIETIQSANMTCNLFRGMEVWHKIACEGADIVSAARSIGIDAVVNMQSGVIAVKRWPKAVPCEIPPALRVETPLGAIVVKNAADPEHPGIYIDLRRPDADDDMPLAMVEFSADDVDFPEGVENIITRVWGDARKEDYTTRVVHKNIEEYFEMEEI